MIIVAVNNALPINFILVTKPRSRRPGRSTQIVGSVLDAVMDTAVDVLVDAKVTAISGSRAMIIRMGI